jgi:ABC-type branched-subunit amino acid transport system substrate-binding protein
VRRIGLLDDGDELGRSYDALLGAQAGPAGLSYVGRATAGPDADQRAALQQLANQGAQVVVLSQQPVGAARAAQAILQLGTGRPQLAGFASLADYGFASLGGDAAVGALLVSTPQTYLTDLPQGQWPPGYRGFVGAAGRQYGLGSDGFQLQASPAAADCLRQWARAVAAAGTFAGGSVTRAWERLDLAPEQTALGVREHLTAGDHTSVAQDGVFAYTWARDGSRYRLRSVPTS